ncbi:response regulator [Rickettsiales bacterium]|nr:response regulator [Rickettsiales bacterium]
MGAKILAVDDSKTIRTMISTVLSAEGYEIIEAEDGAHALSILQEHHFALIITDINMPKINGIELIKHIRKEYGHKDTPVIALTTESNEKIKTEGREAGVTGWMVKPFQPDKMLKIVHHFCTIS